MVVGDCVPRPKGEILRRVRANCRKQDFGSDGPGPGPGPGHGPGPWFERGIGMGFREEGSGYLAQRVTVRKSVASHSRAQWFFEARSQ